MNRNKSDFEALVDLGPFIMSEFDGDKIYNSICENKLCYQTLDSLGYLN